LFILISKFIVPFLEPQLYGENTFILDKNINILSMAENLALEVKYLLNILKTTQPMDIQEQFQIELQKINPHDNHCSTYKMLLRTDSVLWFKHHKLNNNDTKNLEHLYEIGTCYAEKVKSEAEHYPSIINERDIRKISIPDISSNSWCKTERQGILCMLQNASRRSCQSGHYNWCSEENYGPTGECKTNKTVTQHHEKLLHFSNIYQNDKPIYYQCHYIIATLNKKQALCHYCVDPNFRIYVNKIEKPSCYPYFIVAARSDAIPVITLNPIKHCENEIYAQTSDAWQAVLQTLIYMKDQLKLDKLPLHRIYINFGKWSQQEVEDPTRRYCHAHINIVLTPQIIKKINDLYQSKKESNVLFSSLAASVVPPKNHRLDDSIKLVEYMRDNMPPLFIKKNRELRRSISTLKDELQHINEHFRKCGFISASDEQETDQLINDNHVAVEETGISDTL